MSSPPPAQAVVVSSEMNQPHLYATVASILTTFDASDERHRHLRMVGRREGRLDR